MCAETEDNVKATTSLDIWYKNLINMINHCKSMQNLICQKKDIHFCTGLGIEFAKAIQI